MGLGYPRLFVRDELVALLDELVAGPLRVLGYDALFGRGLHGFGFGLAVDQVGVGGEVLEGLAAEVVDGLEAVLVHEGGEALAEVLDQAVAVDHDAGADLDGAGAEEDELGGILAGFDAADAADGPAGELLGDHARAFHDHTQGDGPYSLA